MMKGNSTQTGDHLYRELVQDTAQMAHSAHSAARTTTEFDAFAANYDREIDHPLRRFVDARSNYFIALKCIELRNIIKELELDSAMLTVVDAGCGTGFFEKIMSKDFRRLFSFDISFEMLKVAIIGNTSNACDYLCAGAESIPLPDSSVDFIFASCLFHHMPLTTLVPTLKEFHRVSKKGGYVVCFEHNPLNPITQLVVRTTPLDNDAHLMPVRTISSAFEKAGLEVIDRRFILFAPEGMDQFLYNKFRRGLYRIPFGGQYLVLGRKT